MIHQGSVPEQERRRRKIPGAGTHSEKAAEQTTINEERKGTLLMAGQIFMRVDEVMEVMGISKPYAYKIIAEMNEKLKKTGCITIGGRIDRKYFYEQFYGTRNQDKKED